MNQDIDISFMGSEQTEILSKWNARLGEEEFLALVTTSEATTMDEDGVEVSSKATTQDVSAEVEAILAKSVTVATPA